MTNRKLNILKTIIYLLLMTFLISCVNEIEDKDESNEALPTVGTINYLALGDSYTIGQGVEESERWPNQLSEELILLGYDFNRADIIARTGWTTTNLIRAIANSNVEGYNFVSLLIGVNNQYQGLSFSVFETELDSLLNLSVKIAGSKDRVFVVSIPDYGVTPFGSSNREIIAQELDMYNEYIAARCMEKNIPFINITEISRELGDSEGALASDNLHPSGNQYREWVNEILPSVIPLLSK